MGDKRVSLEGRLLVPPILHVQNIFDALNPNGAGVNGHLKERCLQLQNRVVALANSSDIIATSADCPQAFVDYLLRIVGVSDVVTLRYQASPDPRKYIDAKSVFETLSDDPQWEMVLRRCPVLGPYMKSPAIYQAARTSGIAFSEGEWKAVINARLTEKMNDKAIFYQECDRARIPVPQHWVANGKDLTDCVTDLLETNKNPLYIRQTRSGGTLGNITVERVGSYYLVPELGIRRFGYSEFTQVLKEFAKASFWDEFVIAKLLDLYASPGTLFYADDVDVTIICHTYQILNRSRLFLGFTYPIQDKKISKHFRSIENWLRILVEPWRGRGYRGYGNIDWMITKNGEIFLAERNARQTGVVPPLHVANACSRLTTEGSPIVAPALSIFTRDVAHAQRAMTFEEAYAKLREKNLLWEQSKHGEGVIITIPPSPRFGMNSLGIMAVGPDLPTADEIFSKALSALGSQQNNLLFELKI